MFLSYDGEGTNTGIARLINLNVVHVNSGFSYKISFFL